MSDTKNNELMNVAQESGLDKPKVEVLLSKFGTSFANTKNALAHAKDIKVTSEDQTSEMEEARVARLELKSIRVEVEHTRKELKEQSLREGKAIDGMANIIKAMIVPAEEYLEKQEKFAENIAKERKLRLAAERLNTLLQYTDVPSMYAYQNMEQEAFDKLIVELKTAKEAKKQAEREAETQRLAKEKADREEQERIRVENAKLRAEAEAKEAQLAAERKVAEEAICKQREEAEAKLAAERKIREEAEEAEKERKAKEAMRIAAIEEEKRKSLLAPDKEKLMAFADGLDHLELPAVSNREAGKLLDETKDFLDRISKNLRNKAKEL